jgi:sulfatase maturation enzyme AslB (radical SAM superfamily)
LWQSQFKKLNIPLTPTEMFKTIDVGKFQGERLDSLHELSVNLRHVLIYGGEPLVNDEVIKYLKFLVDSKLSKNIQLTLNTNGTIYDETQIELFNNFKHVDIFLSIDDVDRQFEYQRWPAKWDKINKNILNYKKHCNLNLEFYPTVSVLNVITVGKFLARLSEYDIPITFNNFIHEPKILSVKNLPEEIKKQVIDIINDIDFTKFNFNKLYTEPKQALINFIELKNDEGYKLNLNDYQQRLTESMKIFDEQRKTSMKDYLPEFYGIIYEY